MNLVFRREARHEFGQAAQWYKRRRRGLGALFVTAVERVFDQIVATPARYPIKFKQVREAIVPKFPYCVYYQEIDDYLLIIAVFHNARDPSVWQSRV